MTGNKTLGPAAFTSAAQKVFSLILDVMFHSEEQQK
jgi:hypothetical protein